MDTVRRGAGREATGLNTSIGRMPIRRFDLRMRLVVAFRIRHPTKTDISPCCVWAGRMLIWTSCPRAVRDSIRRPTEKLPARLRMRRDTWGCLIPRTAAASACVKARSRPEVLCIRGIATWESCTLAAVINALMGILPSATSRCRFVVPDGGSAAWGRGRGCGGCVPFPAPIAESRRTPSRCAHSSRSPNPGSSACSSSTTERTTPQSPHRNGGQRTALQPERIGTFSALPPSRRFCARAPDRSGFLG